MQAMQLGYLPRLNIEHTSAEHRGQIYISVVNTALALGCIALVLAFGSSQRLAGAYGVAVSFTMIVTTALLAFVARQRWRWSLVRVGLLLGTFLVIDAAFLGANLLKIDDGGWLPLVLAALLVTVMFTWHRGRQLAGRRLRSRLLPLDEFVDQIARSRTLRRVKGTAVFLTSNPDGTPIALVHNLKHNLIVHERVIVLWFGTSERPRVPETERVSIVPLPAGFWRVNARFGFLEDPEIGPVRDGCRAQGLDWSDMDTTYFLGRESIVRARHPVMPGWRRWLFAALSRNAQEPSAFYRLPPNRVVELGVQVEL
jgi:KUP system potassium uptake protein